MTICLVIDDIVKVPVKGYLNDRTGKAKPFSFSLVCKRLSKDELDAELKDREQKVADILTRVATDWEDVRDAAGQPAPYSAEALQALLGIGNLATIAFSAYLLERGAKEKN